MMWVFTTQGFYSVVEDRHDPEMLVVRTRVKSDLVALQSQIPELKPIHGAGTDYAWRAFVPRQRWTAALLELGDGIDYTNFKDAVKATQGKRRADIYMRVWIALWELPRRRGQARQRSLLG